MCSVTHYFSGRLLPVPFCERNSEESLNQVACVEEPPHTVDLRMLDAISQDVGDQVGSLCSWSRNLL